MLILAASLNASSRALPELRRGLAEGGPEGAVEVGNVGKAAVVADGQDLIVGGAQFLQGGGEAALLEIVAGA